MAEGGITIRRVFDAPRERVWQEWTEPERFADWFGGSEAEVPLETVTMDVRPGGAWRATMFFGPDRHVSRWRGEYFEVVARERLVLTFSNTPDEVYEHVTVVLNDLGSGRTEMLFEQRGHMRPEEYDRTKDGWAGFFDRMEARLRAPASDTADATLARTRLGPLAGLRVVELGGIGPGPFCGMILSDLGAEVIRVDRPAAAATETLSPILLRGRRSVAIDLKSAAGADVVLRLIDTADAVIEGFRPGVTERLGLGPETCLARNSRLVYGRMTGWGQDGPLAQEAGHDIDYIAVAGALGAIGPTDGNPVVPLNLIGDMGGGGMLLALGITAALVHARATGEGQVVDAAMTDGTAIQLAGIHGLLARGLWTDRRGSNLLDGGAPFYRVYRCADDRHVAVGALEPQFYAGLLRVLELTDDPLFTHQHDRSSWPAMGARLEERFATRPRDEWSAAFAGQEACVAPVLSLAEAAAHPHNVARGTYIVDDDGTIQPGPAPRFLGTPTGPPGPVREIGADTDDVLAEAGLGPSDIDALRMQGVVA